MNGECAYPWNYEPPAIGARVYIWIYWERVGKPSHVVEPATFFGGYYLLEDNSMVAADLVLCHRELTDAVAVPN